MPNTTSRLGLLEPVATDLPLELRTAITTNASTLDKSVTITRNTYASRPAAGSVVQDSLFYATDTGVYYVSNGTAWETLPRLGVRSVSGSATANIGDAVIATTLGSTITLPSAVVDGLVSVTTGAGASGSSPITVASGSSNIYGVGVSAASSIKLGVGLASVTFLCDGTNWNMISGAQDTGWVSLSLPANFSAASGHYVPAVRKVGDRVLMRGAAQNGTGGFSGYAGSLPAGFAPAQNVGPLPICDSGSSVFGLSITTGGSISEPGTFTNGNSLIFDGISYPLT